MRGCEKFKFDVHLNLEFAADGAAVYSLNTYKMSIKPRKGGTEISNLLFKSGIEVYKYDDFKFMGIQ